MHLVAPEPPENYPLEGGARLVSYSDFPLAKRALRKPVISEA